MTQEVYTIGDAAKRIRVETHVLRYWEEELGLTIGRNELGHRYYTEEDISLMEHIRQWKEQGLQPVSLKAVLTPNNIRWTPPALFAELQREHAQMH